MRLTSVRFFRHPNFLHFDKKWDRIKPIKKSWYKEWKRSFLLQRNKKIREQWITMAEGYELEDALKYLYTPEKCPVNLPYIWPFEKPFEPGTPNDPNYKLVRAYLFNRKTYLFEGFKGAMSFSNTVLEDSIFPEQILQIENDVNIPPEYIKFLDNKLLFAEEEDGFLQNLGRRRIFPKLNKPLRREFGVPQIRKSFNILESFYDVADIYISKEHRFNDRRKILYPKALMAFERDGKHCITNLQCDFITTSIRDATLSLSPSLISSQNLVYANPENTVDRDLEPIHPINWEICFEKSHFYDENYELCLPKNNQVHSIYLTLNARHLKKFVDRFYKGRALMFAYGYAVAQARLWYGNWNDYKDPLNYKVLENPIIINSVFHNHTKESIGFCSFQLNTTSFDSQIKNQVWFDGPYEYKNDKEKILKKMIALQLFGPFNVSNIEETVVNQANVN